MATEKKIPVILDCDTGGDDAMAMALAIASEKLQVLGVTTVAGNVPLDKVVRNTRNTLSCTDPVVPYAVGAAKPQARALIDSGRPGHVLFEAYDQVENAPDGRDAVTFMADLIRQSPDPVTLIPLAPLTNIAALLRQYPELKSNIAQMVIMGGSFTGGNATGYAEFNIYVDPEAAAEVFSAGIPLVMCGEEVCLQSRVGRPQIEALAALGNDQAKAFAEELELGLREGESIIFDAVTVAWLERPEMFESRPAEVYIECADQKRLGQTVVDFYAAQPNAVVPLNMDRQGFGQMMVDLFAGYSRQ